MLELHATIHGNVQGVGFRATAISYGRRLGLTGLIRNKRDGSVEIIAQGEKPALEKLIASLKGAFDQIEDIELSYTEPVKTFEDFSISL